MKDEALMVVNWSVVVSATSWWTLWLLVLAKVTAANMQDVHAGKQLFSALAQKPELLTRLKKIFADGGYRGELEDWVQPTCMRF